MSTESDGNTSEAESPSAADQAPAAESVPPATEDASPDEEDASPEEIAAPARRWMRFSVRRDVMVLSVLLVASVVCIAFLGWRLSEDGRSARDARASLAAMQETAKSQQHAEQVALDYAKGAADMNYQDLPSWTKRLTANTSPELAQKLKEASASMEQIIVPLQWVSTPTPIAATVRSEHDGVFVVNCFVSVMTKNVQAPDGVQATATYTVTINKNSNWVITDVGGVDSALKAGR